MPTIMVAKAFSLLLSPADKPIRFEKGEHDVEDHIAEHWYVQQHIERDETAEAETLVIITVDPAVASRDELIGYLRGSFDAYLATLSDDDLRESAAYQLRRDDAGASDSWAADLADLAGPATEVAPDAAASLEGGAAADSIDGGAGQDTVTAADPGAETQSDTAGPETVTAAEPADSINGAAAHDEVEDADAKKPAKGKAKSDA